MKNVEQDRLITSRTMHAHLGTGDIRYNCRCIEAKWFESRNRVSGNKRETETVKKRRGKTKKLTKEEDNKGNAPANACLLTVISDNNIRVRASKLVNMINSFLDISDHFHCTFEATVFSLHTLGGSWSKG